MGVGYSKLNVYFKSVVDHYKVSGCTVTPKQSNFQGCSDFQVITHTIVFDSKTDALYYNVLFYDGSNDPYTGEYIFGYYYPNNDNEVIESVSIYYSVLAPKDPLVISITTKGKQQYNCLPADLKEARWDRAYNIDIYSRGRFLTKDLLDNEFKKISRNRKICFKIGKESKEIKRDKQVLDPEYYRFIYRPEGNDAILVCDHLFSFYSAEHIDSKLNKLNEYYLTHLDNKLFDGIMVYYKTQKITENNNRTKEPVLLEFIETSKKKIQLKKKDKNGNWWSQETVSYQTDAELLECLKKITQEVKDEWVTIILDKKKTYTGVQEVKEVPGQAYNKYTYTFNSPNKPIFLFERHVPDITPLKDPSFKTKCVDVYYLKTVKGEDSEPFLIAIEENGGGGNSKKTYHFANEYKFKDWKKCEETKIEDKLPKIDAYSSCIPVLGLLRWYAFQILTGKEPSEKEIKQEEENQRPQVKVPKTETPLPINWIIGGSVGGGVFVISSAALYGVYWYNTTIKLLT